MNLKTPEELNTLGDTREAYANLLSLHETTVVERAKETQAFEKSLQEAQALRGDLSAANEMLDEATQNIGYLTEQLSQSRESEQKLTGNLTQTQEQVKGLETRIKQLESEAKTAEAQEAAQICASVGVDPAKVTPGGEPKQQSLLEQMRSIENPAQQMAFFRKHKEAILRGH